MCHRSTMHVEERFLAPPALVMYSSRHDSLPGAGLSEDDHLGVARGRLLGELQDRADRGAFADEVRRTHWRQHAPECRVLAP